MTSIRLCTLTPMVTYGYDPYGYGPLWLWTPMVMLYGYGRLTDPYGRLW